MMADKDTPRNYDEVGGNVSDNAYLYYIHFQVGRTNRLLEEIKRVLYLILVAVFMIGIQFYWF